MSTLDGLKRADGVVKRVSTGCAVAPCGHEGLIEFDPSAKSLMPYKCLTCGLTFSKNPSVSKEDTDDKPASNLAMAMGKRLNQAFAAREDGCSFEEAVDAADKDARTLLDQAAKNIDRIAGKCDGGEQGGLPGGSTPSLYALPKDAVELQDLIEHRGMNFAVGNVFKACYRLGMKRNVDAAYDLRKIIFFAERELRRIENLSE